MKAEPRHIPRFAKRFFLWALPVLLPGGEVLAADPGLELFERTIRPALIDHCYECHGGGTKKPKSGYDLTWRDGLRAGGDYGVAVVPSEPERSPLLTALRYDDSLLQMPPEGKLPDELVAAFEEWIRLGAPDPRAERPSSSDSAREPSWEETLRRRSEWWSFQPIRRPPLPEPADAAWRLNEIDRFVRADLDAAGVEPAAEADASTVLRRLNFALIGLPPSPEDLSRFRAAYERDAAGAVEAEADRLLASERFGEKWARHWMDWFRYSETHGSEGDPAIPYAWRYRDYLIRALNRDVPYDALVREHVAGDLLDDPRTDPDLGTNESAIGAAHFRFVLHGFAPTDPLDEQVRFTENQIDVLSKAVLGVTVACARCHDHKFDPVGQKDYYALYGIMTACRPATIMVDAPERANRNRLALRMQKERIRRTLAGIWLAEIETLPDRLASPDEAWKRAIGDATTPLQPLHAWLLLGGAEGDSFRRGWEDLARRMQGSREALERRRNREVAVRWDLGSADAETWFASGNGVANRPGAAGDFSIAETGPTVVRGIYPAGVYSHLLSTRHGGSFSSPEFEVGDHNLFLRVAGEGDAVARYVVRNYPRDGTVYPVLAMNDGRWRWQHWDLSYWKGETVHVEVSTAADQPVLANTGRDRSWFGVAEAIVAPRDAPPPSDEPAEFVDPLFRDAAPKDPVELAGLYRRALRASVEAWRDSAATNEQARFLDYFATRGLLSNRDDASAELRAATERYRELEHSVPVPIRVPGLVEAEPADKPLFIRGNHKAPGDLVPRRFLEAIDPTPYSSANSGRLDLAESLVSPDNPLVARVIANRLWHHVFGRGIVATPDDFGVMGEAPTHPLLLDRLASDMADGWSIKRMIRAMTTSRTFRLDSIPTETAREKDPTNRLFSRGAVRRLEAEAVRDSMLAVSGRLSLAPPEGSVAGDSANRSVYVRVIRNQPEPFLSAFDFPTPFTTRGRRDATNVPDQSLTTMNDPFVRGLAKDFGARFASPGETDARERRVALMFETAIGRPPEPEETDALLGYFDSRLAQASGEPGDATDAWTDLAHSIFSLKEFVYLR